MEAWLVVQVMVADVDVMFVAVTAVNNMGATPVVVKVKSPELVVTPDEFAETTEKWYVVPGVRPEIGTTWYIANVLLRADCEPYAAVVPYFTCDEVGWSLVQRMLAVVSVTGHAPSLLSTGGAVSVVAKVKFTDVVDPAKPLTDVTA